MQPSTMLSIDHGSPTSRFVAVLADATGNGDELHVTFDPTSRDATVELFEGAALTAIAALPCELQCATRTSASLVFSAELSGTGALEGGRSVTLAVSWTAIPSPSGGCFDIAGTAFVTAAGSLDYRRFKAVSFHPLMRFGHLDELVQVGAQRPSVADHRAERRARYRRNRRIRPSAERWPSRFRHAA